MLIRFSDITFPPYRYFMINKEKLFLSVQFLLRVAREYRLQTFAFRYSKIYFAVVLATALAGYAFLLLFPLLVLISIAQLVDVAQSYPFSVDSISQALAWFGVFTFSAAMCHHIFTVTFESPKGVAIPTAKAPKLFELINTHQNQPGLLNLYGLLGNRLHLPMFHAVVLSEHFELAIYKTPINGLPVWSKNTLVIGFPLMQTLPEHYFNFAIARKFMQYAKGRNVVTNWLHQLQEIWLLYPDAFSRRKLLGEQLIVWFFRWYAPMYKKVSAYTAQQDEMMADTLALRDINDSDLFKTIQSQVVGHYFFCRVYLPMLGNLVKRTGGNPVKISPYTTLPSVFRKTVNDERCKQWLEGFQQNAPGFNLGQANEPVFSQRMSNIGQIRLRLPKLGQRSAAEVYFDAHYALTAQLMDTVWRNKIMQQLKRRRQSVAPVRRTTLSAKAVTG
jgi:hypothetical protein